MCASLLDLFMHKNVTLPGCHWCTHTHYMTQVKQLISVSEVAWQWQVLLWWISLCKPHHHCHSRLQFGDQLCMVGNPYATCRTERIVLVPLWRHVQMQQAVFSNILCFILLNSVSVIFIIILSVSIVIMELPYQFDVRTYVWELL